jgi:hypothetical protein
MADILKYKTIDAVEGAVSVNSGLPLAQIIKVARQGEQKDFTPFVNLSTMGGSEWTYYSVLKRIIFGAAFPFAAGEKIYIMYKVSV